MRLVEDPRGLPYNPRVLPRRSPWMEIGLGLILVGAPLVFLPASRGPFAEPKLVFAEAGALAIWISRPPVDQRLVLPAALWVTVLGLAGAVGVDPWWSLTGPENLLSGVLLLGTSAYVLVAGTGVPAALAARVPGWLVAVGTAASLTAAVSRLSPGLLDRVAPGLSFEGGTLGHPVFLSGLAATGIVAALGLRETRPAWLAVAVAALATGLALSTKRVGWVALAAGLLVAIPRLGTGRGRILLVAGTAIATLAAWTAADALLDLGPVSGARRFGELGTDSARSRLVIHRVLGRAIVDRPLLGWGPGNTWSAYLANAEPGDVELAGRGVGDAHDLLLESATTSGVVGLAALLFLAVRVATILRRSPRSLGWAVGATVALVVLHLLQPVNVAMTPMLFLLAGLAAGAGPAHVGGTEEVRAVPVSVVIRAVLGALLAAGLLASCLLLAASVLEHHGRTYAEAWALRASLRLAPGRVSAAEALAIHLALDGRSGDQAAAQEAERLAAATVSRHPWNPAVRLIAADVELLLRDVDGARAWLRRQSAQFPVDRAVLPRDLETGPAAAPSPA